MTKFISVYILFCFLIGSAHSFAQNDTVVPRLRDKKGTEIYAGVSASAIQKKNSFTGYFVGARDIGRKALWCGEIHYILNNNSWLTDFHKKENTVIRSLNCELSLGKIIGLNTTRCVSILQMGARMQHVYYRGSEVNTHGLLFDTPYYEERNFWIPGLVVKASLNWNRHKIGRSIEVYGTICRYTELGLRFAIHLR